MLTQEQKLKMYTKALGLTAEDVVAIFKKRLTAAQLYANLRSGCKKVAVGSEIIVHGGHCSIHGANCVLFEDCKNFGCLRMEKYGEDSKNHRNPEDCRAIHSEIDAITRCARRGISTDKASIIITRYPCEACARAIIDAGITCVVYGRKQKISKETERMFDTAGVEVFWISDWEYEDTER